MAKHDPIEAIIRHDLTSEGAQVIAMLTENGPRDDLTPVEEAHGYQLALDLNGLTLARLARRLGKPKATVQRRIALIRLPEEVQERVHAHQISLQDADTLVEFASDRKVLDVLLQHVGSQSFAYHVAVQRHEQENARRVAGVRLELEKAGVRVIESPAGYPWSSAEKPVTSFVDPAEPASDDDTPVRFTVETHRAACQFHGAFVNRSTFEAEHVCTNPDEAGHARPYVAPRPVLAATVTATAEAPVDSTRADADAQAAEDERHRLQAEALEAEARRRDDMAVATRLRQDFLATLVGRGGRAHLQAVLRLLVNHRLESWLQHAEWDQIDQLARLIDARLPEQESCTWDEAVQSLRAALDSRRSVDAIAGALLAIRANEFESDLAAGGWDYPPCHVYLDWLIAQGYEPTEIERELLGLGHDASA